MSRRQFVKLPPCPKCSSEAVSIWRDGGARELRCISCGLVLYVRKGETVEHAYQRQIVRKERADG